MLSVLIFILIHPNVIGSETAIQAFDREPIDQTAVVGSKVILPCRVINKKGILQWTKDDFGLGIIRSLDGYARYRMEGSDDENDFSLIIDPVTLDDDAKYQCQVSQTSNQPQLRSRSAKLTVLYPPEKPEIVQGSHLNVTAGKEIQLECESRSGKPAAEIVWMDGDGKQKKGECITIYQSDGKKADKRCAISFVVTRSHQNKTFTCQSHNGALAQPLTTHITLWVKYQPVVRLSASLQKIVESDNVTFMCSAKSNPKNVTVRWFKNKELIRNESGMNLTIFSINRTFNEAKIKCEVSNVIGSTSACVDVIVNHPPEIVKIPSNISGDLGSTIIIKCEVLGYPKAKIIWIQKATQKILSVQNKCSLEIKNLSRYDSGWYVCKAIAPGFPAASSDVRVYVNAAPFITSPPSQIAFVGGSAYVYCSTEFSVGHETAAWVKEGANLSASKRRIGKEIDSLEANNCSDQKGYYKIFSPATYEDWNSSAHCFQANRRALLDYHPDDEMPEEEFSRTVKPAEGNGVVCSAKEPMTHLKEANNSWIHSSDRYWTIDRNERNVSPSNLIFIRNKSTCV